MEKTRVACLLSHGFEDSELRIPAERLRQAGFQVDVIGGRAGQWLSGSRGKELVETDHAIDQAIARDYVALLIPGGHSPDHLRADPRFVELVREFNATGRPMAAIGHGPQLLITARLVRGRTMTAWRTIQDDLRQLGAEVRDEPVVVDGNWITSRQAEDLDAFSDALIRALAERAGTSGTDEKGRERVAQSHPRRHSFGGGVVR